MPDSSVRIEKQWDRDGENSLLYVIVSAVAEAADTDPLELSPLADAVDPEALERLVTSSSGSPRITFEYAGYTIDVRSDGTVLVGSV